jgi:glycosyltransferase involved in cell wall biosynthesis
LRILQLGKAYPPVNLGGVEVVIELFTKGLNEENYPCDALGVNDKYEFVAEKNVTGGVIYRTKLLKKAFSTLFSIQLISFLNKIKGKYDIIHIHTPDPMAALALYFCRPSCKIVLHWHSDILRQKVLLFFYNPLLHWLVKRADLILATSPNYIEHSSYLKENILKTKVLPIGLNIEYEIVEKELNIQLTNRYYSKKIIFSLGRLAYYKGYEHLILAANYLPDDYVIVIAGGGNEREYLTKIIIDNDLKDKVLLVGKISESEKVWYFKNCMIFALSSIFKTEAYAIVQVEAMAYGKPVVSTEIAGSGVSWVNMNGESGITVPIKDSKAIAEACLEIMTNEVLYNKYAQGALARYNKCFTRDIMINKLIHFYKHISEE